MVRSISRRLFVAALAATLLISISCGHRDAPPAQSAPTSRSVVDDLGRTVEVPQSPQRIISLAPNLTEIVFALGAGDRLVGVTSYCDYPPEASQKTSIGDTIRPDLERLIALTPDLVLVSTASQMQALTERLEALHIPVYVSNPRNVSGVLASIRGIGGAINSQAEADALVNGLSRRLDAVAAAVRDKDAPKVFLMVGNEPLITTGKGTFVDDLIRRAGGVSVTGEEPTEWPQISAETIIARAPDAIVIPLASHGISDENGGVPKSLSETPAARKGRIIRINADLLMRPGPRLVDGLELLAKALHPEAFR